MGQHKKGHSRFRHHVASNHYEDQIGYGETMGQDFISFFDRVDQQSQWNKQNAKVEKPEGRKGFKQFTAYSSPEFFHIAE
jgi:hypothetical protein